MDVMITIIVIMDAKPELRAQVRSRLIELASLTRRESGNVFYVLHESVADPNRFVIYERWKDQAALDFHMAQPYLKRFLDDGASQLQGPVNGTICRAVEW